MKRIKIDQWGYPSHYNLECGEDGIIRVKNGMSLEDYINSPAMVKARKKAKHSHGDQLLISKSHFERNSLTQYA